jgi:peptidoglycan/xylan/chitin deacetylase (PgdA/CDA1 family)
MTERLLNKGNLIVTTSWDDGTVTDLKLAGLMEKYGVKGTFYIATSFLHNPLPKNDIIALGKKFEIGAHTVNHPNLINVSLPEAEREIRDSRTYLEDLVGNSICMFNYPFGTYNDTIKRIVKDSGFIAARTCDPGGFNLPEDPYQWHITSFASNGSPLMALKIWWGSRLWKIGSLLDWESRAKSLFDLALEKGGIYHIYGHSAESESNNEWDKLERVFAYISRKESVRYMTNGEIFR